MTNGTSFDETFNANMQKNFLKLLIFDKEWATLSGFDIIKPEYFENRILHNICTWIHNHYKKYKKMPSYVTLAEDAKDFISKKSLSNKDYYLYDDKIKEILDLNDDENLDFYKDKAAVFVRQSAWKQALQKGGSVLEKENYEEALEAFKNVLSLGSVNSIGLDMIELTPDDFIEKLRHTYDKGSMIKTGVPSWDAALGGGFVKKNIHIIGGAPGGGKSRTMAFLAKQALMDLKRVIFVTLELTEEETFANIATSATGLNIHDMLKDENKQEFDEKYATFKNKYGGDIVVKFFKPNCITADGIHNFIQKVIRHKETQAGMAWKPDVIYLDYMDKLLPTTRTRQNGNQYEDGGTIATDCKNLAISFDCPVITGSQLGRYSWDLKGNDVISMASVAESAAKVHLAHSMTTINSNPGEKANSRARLFLAKSRSGTPGTVVWVENNLGRCLMFEVDPWDPVTLEGTSVFTIKNTNNTK